jgi:hypothetical protein
MVSDRENDAHPGAHHREIAVRRIKFDGSSAPIHWFSLLNQKMMPPFAQYNGTARPVAYARQKAGQSAIVSAS